MTWSAGREGIQGPPGPAFSAAERDAIRKAIGVLKRVGAEKVATVEEGDESPEGSDGADNEVRDGRERGEES